MTDETAKQLIASLDRLTAAVERGAEKIAFAHDPSWKMEAKTQGKYLAQPTIFDTGLHQLDQ